MDWFTPLVGFLGVVIGLGFQELRIRRERKDKYKDMVFEKRLDAHQGAYYWCMRLLNLMWAHKLMRDGGVKVAVGEAWEATEWLNKNALYLDEGSRARMNVFFEYVAKTGRKYLDEKRRGNIDIEEETRNLLENLREVVSSIKRGIGVRYLPERGMLGVDIGRWESDDEVVKRIVELVKEEMR
jgi:hypothetical protein